MEVKLEKLFEYEEWLEKIANTSLKDLTFTFKGKVLKVSQEEIKSWEHGNKTFIDYVFKDEYKQWKKEYENLDWEPYSEIITLEDFRFVTTNLKTFKSPKEVIPGEFVYSYNGENKFLKIKISKKYNPPIITASEVWINEDTWDYYYEMLPFPQSFDINDKRYVSYISGILEGY